MMQSVTKRTWKNGRQLTAAVCALLGFSSVSHADVASTGKLKVLEISRNAGTEFGIRLNESVDRSRHPRALDAEFECNDIDETLRIVFCEDGLCDIEGGPVFHEFDDTSECFAAQDSLKKKLKSAKRACLRVETSRRWFGGTERRLVIDDKSACD